MIRQLAPWVENIAKRQVKSPKIYFRDSGIFHTLLGVRSEEELRRHPKLGASWEGYEIKFTDHPRVTKSMRIARHDLRLDRLTVIVPGASPSPVDVKLPG